MLVEFKDFLKTLNVGDYFAIGKIDSTKDKSIGVYGNSTSNRIESIGKESSYDIANIRVLVHWNKNLRETEIAARSIFEQLRYKTKFYIGNIFIDLIDLTTNEPIFVGTDNEGIYEYVITLRLYYRR